MTSLISSTSSSNVMVSEQQNISPQEALGLYKNTLNFNVISRYDPAVKQLLYTTSHCVLYKYDDSSQEWIKTDFQGALTLYLRDFVSPTTPGPFNYSDLQKLFCYGLLLLNRLNPEFFSLGLLPNKITKHYFPHGLNGNGILEMGVEIADNLIMVKNLLGEIYGLWIFNEEDRQKLFKLMSFCLDNEMKQ